uniref:Endonuclease/exonuclease/phosphatase domain-containing protein n=1 Tax=Amphimedon queenslandica TaxID=400682 RepID=A0A1X7SKH1_AMPQE
MNGEIIPSSYMIYRCDRATRGGGVLLAVHHSVPSSPLASPPALEILCVKVLAVVFCLVYIPPNASCEYISKLLSFIGELLSSYRYVVILGDFNAPDICWDTQGAQSQSSRLICEFVFRNNLCQFVDFPTHVA